MRSTFQAEVTFAGVDGELKSQTSFRFDFASAISPWLRFMAPLLAFVLLARRRLLNLLLAYGVAAITHIIGNLLIPADEKVPLLSIMQTAVLPLVCLLAAFPWIVQAERRIALGRAVLLMSIAGLVCATVLTSPREWAYVPQFMLIVAVTTMVTAAGHLYGGLARNERDPAAGFILRSIAAVTGLSIALSCVYPVFPNLVALSWAWSIPVYLALPYALSAGVVFLFRQNRMALQRAVSGSLKENDDAGRASRGSEVSERVLEEAIK